MSRATKRKYFAFLVLIYLLTDDEYELILAKRNRINWVRPWMARREEIGEFHQLVRELAWRMLQVTKNSFESTVNSSSFCSFAPNN